MDIMRKKRVGRVKRERKGKKWKIGGTDEEMEGRREEGKELRKEGRRQGRRQRNARKTKIKE